MAKSKNEKMFICNNCGYESGKWLGQCPSCGEWGSMEEIIKEFSNSVSRRQSGAKIQTISQVEADSTFRFSSGLGEVDRVLGSNVQAEQSSGFVKGQVILLTGEPGIGKSTILLQILANLVEKQTSAVYVSAEESVSQVALRASRLLGDKYEKLTDEIKMLNSYNVENILENLESAKPGFVVVDSIQTIYSDDSATISGSVSQIKICASKLVNYAKANNVTVVIVGHVNKEGTIAGPKLLEHLVDTVLSFEGDPDTGIRILRSVKNRFGTTNEVGMFEMTSGGLTDLVDPSSLFFSHSDEKMIGVCKTVVMEGNRPLVVEVQALTSGSPFSLPKRVAEGVAVARLQRICAILDKYVKANLSNTDVYLKIAGGLKYSDPGIELAICTAILSSILNVAVDSKLLAVGEVNLTGMVTKVIRQGEKLNEVKRLGYPKPLYSEVIGNVREIRRFLDKNNYKA